MTTEHEPIICDGCETDVDECLCTFCEVCDETIPDGEGDTLSDGQSWRPTERHVCQDCRWTCESCCTDYQGDHGVTGPGGETICEGCRDDSTFYCEGCDELFWTDDYGSDGYCQDCERSHGDPGGVCVVRCYTCQTHTVHFDLLSESFVCDHEARELATLDAPLVLAYPLPVVVEQVPVAA